jgi:hypothetical protein
VHKLTSSRRLIPFSAWCRQRNDDTVNCTTTIKCGEKEIHLLVPGAMAGKGSDFPLYMIFILAHFPGRTGLNRTEF